VPQVPFIQQNANKPAPDELFANMGMGMRASIGAIGKDLPEGPR
jgi:hypothetical protein